MRRWDKGMRGGETEGEGVIPCAVNRLFALITACMIDPHLNKWRGEGKRKVCVSDMEGEGGVD